MRPGEALIGELRNLAILPFEIFNVHARTVADAAYTHMEPSPPNGRAGKHRHEMGRGRLPDMPPDGGLTRPLRGR
jgi:hypothetical protein